MSTNEKTAKMDMKAKLSTLWIVVMFNMAFADILGFMFPEFLEILETGYAGGMQITQGLMLTFAIILEIPIAMIFLSRVLKYGANRWANIIASVITIAFVILGGSTELSYIFFAAVEIVCMLLIVRDAWKWTNPEA